MKSATDALIHLRVPAELKTRWVRESRAAGMRLTDWIIEKVEGNHMITNIELAPAGVEKFNRFFSAHARDGVSLQAVTLEMMDAIQDRAIMGESLVYELGRQYTVSGKPELLTLKADDILITTAQDDE